MVNELTPKTKFIMDTQKQIEELIKDKLHQRMKQYTKRFGFTHDDMFMWHACSISWAVCSESVKMKCSVKIKSSKKGGE